MARVQHVDIRNANLQISGKIIFFDENGIGEVDDAEAELLVKDCGKWFLRVGDTSESAISKDETKVSTPKTKKGRI